MIKFFDKPKPETKNFINFINTLFEPFIILNDNIPSGEVIVENFNFRNDYSITYIFVFYCVIYLENQCEEMR